MFVVAYWISTMRDCFIMNAGWFEMANNQPTLAHKLNVFNMKKIPQILPSEIRFSMFDLLGRSLKNITIF